MLFESKKLTTIDDNESHAVRTNSIGNHLKVPSLSLRYIGHKQKIVALTTKQNRIGLTNLTECNNQHITKKQHVVNTCRHDLP